jgi:phosphate/phosphite/phosphonate ABC transporter binding protein
LKTGVIHDLFHRAPLGAQRGARLRLRCHLSNLPAVAEDAVLRVSAIPDEAPTELQRKFAPLGKYLEAQTGMKVVFTPVSDYAAVVESLATKKIDLAWLGGFTFIQAKIRTNGTAIPIAQREEDAKFTSKFITADPAIKTLADLKGKTFAFGRTVLDLGQPDAALLPAAGRPQSGNRLQARRLLRRA